MTFADLSTDEKAELWACLALRHGKAIGALRGKRLVLSFGSALLAVEACLKSPSLWAERELLPVGACRDFATQGWRGKAKEEWEALQKQHCSFVFWSCATYPHLLREIPDAPLLLYYKGDFSLLSSPSVGIVGSRKCSREGIRLAAFFGRGLSCAGVTVISGMAEGIDRAAHLAGLEGVGSSIAVLGTGIDLVYPPCNADLAGLMEKKGLILTEFPPNTSASSRHFPVRNRLISGLSRGVLVVEAAARSGSLITARLALEQGRDVFAVPGAGTSSSSEGCRDLIRRGAKPVFAADDVLQELAPLLTLDARRALEARSKPKSARDYQVDIAEATAVLPDGQIPWLAPESSKKSTTTNKTRAATKKTENKNLDKKSAGSKPASAGSFDAKATQIKPVDLSTLNAEELRLVQGLSAQPVHIDTLALAVGMDVAKVSGFLTILEIRGIVQRLAGMLYKLP